MHEPGSKSTTTTTTRGSGPKMHATSQVAHHGSTPSLVGPPSVQYYCPPAPLPHAVPPPGSLYRRQMQMRAGIPPSNAEELALSLLPQQQGGPPQGHVPPNHHQQGAPPLPLPQQHQVQQQHQQQQQQQQQCKKNLQKMMGISPSDIDKYSRIFFPISFTCFNLMYWIIYLHVSDEVADDLVMLNG